MVIVLFRNRLSKQAGDEYESWADEILALAREMPGYVDFRAYVADDGERIAISWWRDDDSVANWREQARHRVAQQLGRDRFYDEYWVEVAQVVRESRHPADGGST
jgi:heme-degrading monooxygenase HmoA